MCRVPFLHQFDTLRSPGGPLPARSPLDVEGDKQGVDWPRGSGLVGMVWNGHVGARTRKARPDLSRADQLDLDEEQENICGDHVRSCVLAVAFRWQTRLMEVLPWMTYPRISCPRS